VRLIVDSVYIDLTLKSVVEHIHRMILEGALRARYADGALNIIVTLVKKSSFPPIDVAWVDGLLRSAAKGKMKDDMFVHFLRLRGTVKGGPFGGTVASEITVPEDALFKAIPRAIKICSGQEEEWEDEAMYGGLTAIVDIPRLGSYLPDVDFFETLSCAMRSHKPFHVRKAAFDVIQAAQNGWLRSATLRETLHAHDFPKQLHDIVRVADCDHRCAFLDMMEILSKGKKWHSYLRDNMDIWLPFRSEGRKQTACILANIGEISFPDVDVPDDSSLVGLVRDEWMRVPGRSAGDLTTDLLAPLAGVTKRLNELLFNETDRKAVFVVVEQVIPSLERRRDHGDERLGEDVRGLVNSLLETLRMPNRPRARHRPASWI
jgi:hypothetical protein